MNKLMTLLRRKMGPLTVWQWMLLVTAFTAAFIFYRRRMAPATPVGPNGETGGSYDPVTGEWKSSQSTETVDPVTGERKTSTYEASGPSGSLISPGSIGWSASPMPYSGGDVYVNSSGDNYNMNYRPARYPPAQGTGPVTGQTVGGYWWTPQNRDDVRFMVGRAGLNPDPDFLAKVSPEGWAIFNAAASYQRIIESNPQIDWTVSRTPEQWIGTPVFIPTAPGGWQTSGQLPRGGSLTGPPGYKPPQQTQVMSPAA